MRRYVVSWFGTARVVVALLTRRNTLPVAPWLGDPLVVSVRGRKGIGGAPRRVCSPRFVPPLDMPRVLDHSSGVSAAIGVSLRTAVVRSRVRTMASMCRGGAIAIVGSAVRIYIAFRHRWRDSAHRRDRRPAIGARACGRKGYDCGTLHASSWCGSKSYGMS
jgi:hypothetical protein